MIDINSKHLEVVKSILAKHLPGYEIWAFGSRIDSTAKKYSDLDLVIITDIPVPLITIASVKEAFSESNLPFKVDIIDWSITSENFRKIIKERYTVIQKSG
ncbi:MAG: DNA polymerase beta subunit [Coxiella sp. DG_40]|nr:MAG: DNA polymerase beta subunit [Coxiella sp. DG_40]